MEPQPRAAPLPALRHSSPVAAAPQLRGDRQRKPGHLPGPTAAGLAARRGRSASPPRADPPPAALQAPHQLQDATHAGQPTASVRTAPGVRPDELLSAFLANRLRGAARARRHARGRPREGGEVVALLGSAQAEPGSAGGGATPRRSADVAPQPRPHLAASRAESALPARSPTALPAQRLLAALPQSGVQAAETIATSLGEQQQHERASLDVQTSASPDRAPRPNPGLLDPSPAEPFVPGSSQPAATPTRTRALCHLRTAPRQDGREERLASPAAPRQDGREERLASPAAPLVKVHLGSLRGRHPLPAAPALAQQPGWKPKEEAGQGHARGVPVVVAWLRELGPEVVLARAQRTAALARAEGERRAREGQVAAATAALLGAARGAPAVGSGVVQGVTLAGARV